jgi:hypothetical protein
MAGFYQHYGTNYLLKKEAAHLPWLRTRPLQRIFIRSKRNCLYQPAILATLTG